MYKSVDVQAILHSSGYDVYQASSTLAFALSEDNTLVITPFHVFRVKYDHANYRVHLRNLRSKIQMGDMNTVDELISFCKFRPGNRSKMYGLELQTTNYKYHIKEIK